MKIQVFAAVVAFALLLPQIAIAQTSDDVNDSLHREHVAVRLDGVLITTDSSIYASDDDDTIFVSAADVDAWNLKRPLKGAFTRDGRDYFGLQTDLNLAIAYDKVSRELEITAPRSAFLGQPSTTVLPPLSPGSGAFLNYLLNRENDTFDFYAAGRGGVFQQRYLATTGDEGLEFHRSRTRWFRLNSKNHTILQLGDDTADGGWLGVSAPFAGLHYATDFSSDPEYVPSGPPSVSGIALAPSLLEVYVDNVLALRRDVPQGPFTVRDLPASASHSDIVMVLTDANGNRTFQVARPSYDPDFLGRGRTTFAFNAGLAHENVDLVHSYYRGGVANLIVRHGLTGRITGEVYGESVNGENFADAGADVQLGQEQTIGFRIGGGNKRHSSQYEYKLRRGKFRVREQFSFNSMASEPFDELNFGNVVAQVREQSEFAIDFSRNISTSIRFDRSRDSRGFDSSQGSVRTRFRAGPLTLEVTPFYDFVRRRMSANVLLSARLNSDERLMTRGAVTTQGQTSGAIEFRKDPSDPSDPISLTAKVSAGRTQDRRVFITDETPWIGASLNVQQLYGKTIYEPEAYGTLAFLSGRVYGLRSVGENESFGVVHLQNLRNVRVSVNSSEVGRTNARGDLIVRDLAPFRDNAIAISTDDLPIDVSLADPQHVVPSRSSPLALNVRVVARGGFIVRIVNARGTPLDPGSQLASAAAQYPVGYMGRAFVTGLAPGAQKLTGTIAGVRCVAQVDVPKDLSAIPDLGQAVCR